MLRIWLPVIKSCGSFTFTKYEGLELEVGKKYYTYYHSTRNTKSTSCIVYQYQSNHDSLCMLALSNQRIGIQVENCSEAVPEMSQRVVYKFEWIGMQDIEDRSKKVHINTHGKTSFLQDMILTSYMWYVQTSDVSYIFYVLATHHAMWSAKLLEAWVVEVDFMYVGVGDMYYYYS